MRLSNSQVTQVYRGGDPTFVVSGIGDPTVGAARGGDAGDNAKKRIFPI